MQADQINWPTTIGNLGLWTELGIPTKATRFKTHRLVRFFVGFPCPVGVCVGWRSRAGRAVFILFGAGDSKRLTKFQIVIFLILCIMIINVF